MNEASLFLRALAGTYALCARKAAAGLRRNWRIMIGSWVGYTAVVAAERIFAPWGVAGGFMVGLAGVAVLAIYYGWVAETVRQGRLQWRDLLQFDYGLFSATLSVAFIFFLVVWLAKIGTFGGQAVWLLLCVKLALVVVFNAVPEVIHQRRYEGMTALGCAAAFTLANWIEWFIPLLVLAAPVLLVLPSYFLLTLASTEPLLPVLLIVRSWGPLGETGGALMSLVGLVLGNWFMLFRAHLFNELEGGSRRSRMYKARMG